MLSIMLSFVHKVAFCYTNTVHYSIMYEFTVLQTSLTAVLACPVWMTVTHVAVPSILAWAWRNSKAQLRQMLQSSAW